MESETALREGLAAQASQAAAQAAAEAVRAPSPAASNVTEVSELRRVVGVRVEPKLRVSHGSGSSVRVSALCLAGGTVRCCRAS